MAKAKVYIESSVIGCLTLWSSRDIVREAHRQITRAWWDERRSEYELFISQIVLDEISKGDPAAVADRLEAVKKITLLEVNETVASMASELVKRHALPRKALQDAFHIATSAYHQVDILLTWNCTHIANPHILHQVRKFLADTGLPMPEVTTPEGLMGEDNGD